MRSVYMHACCCPYLFVLEISCYFESLALFLHVCVRMYRRTSNMAGLTYPPTALTALKVNTVLKPQSHLREANIKKKKEILAN